MENRIEKTKTIEVENMTDPIEGFLKFSAFMKKLQEKYPDKNYPSEEVVDRINPASSQYGKVDLNTYLARENGETIGVVIGEVVPDGFEGQWFVIDPEYQNSEVTRKLMEAVIAKHKRVWLTANMYGESNSADLDKKLHRQQALVKYYGRLGFKPNKESEIYKYHLEYPDAPVPMVWEAEDAPEKKGEQFPDFIDTIQIEFEIIKTRKSEADYLKFRVLDAFIYRAKSVGFEFAYQQLSDVKKNVIVTALESHTYWNKDSIAELDKLAKELYGTREDASGKEVPDYYHQRKLQERLYEEYNDK